MPAWPCIAGRRRVDLRIRSQIWGARERQGRGGVRSQARDLRSRRDSCWPLTTASARIYARSTRRGALAAHAHAATRSARVSPPLLLLLAPLLAGCGEGAKAPAAPPPPAVTVAKPVKRTIVDQDEYVGRFVAVDSVEVRARVSGYLDKVHFTDGQIVKEGDLLFTIDKRPFQNALDQARANLAQVAQSNVAFTASRSRARPAAGARPHHHRADLRAAHPGQAQSRRPRSRRTRRWCARPSST